MKKRALYVFWTFLFFVAWFMAFVILPLGMVIYIIYPKLNTFYGNLIDYLEDKVDEYED